MAQNVNLMELADAHTAFTTSAELGADAASEAPATSPLCVTIFIGGVTLGAGC
ncbi:MULTISPECIES: LxmA leader domain family RiPP [Rothia]|uniref:LxmA leader domain family RiPP n=1 Tax=Rothia TaxID=32207 RepID=UPI001F230308|nr:LxmA leader domain family RiPP [Rothia endophytica]